MSSEFPLRQHAGGTSLLITLGLYSCKEEVCPPGGLEDRLTVVP